MLYIYATVSTSIWHTKVTKASTFVTVVPLPTECQRIIAYFQYLQVRTDHECWTTQLLTQTHTLFSSAYVHTYVVLICFAWRCIFHKSDWHPVDVGQLHVHMFIETCAGAFVLSDREYLTTSRLMEAPIMCYCAVWHCCSVFFFRIKPYHIRGLRFRRIAHDLSCILFEKWIILHSNAFSGWSPDSEMLQSSEFVGMHWIGFVCDKMSLMLNNMFSAPIPFMEYDSLIMHDLCISPKMYQVVCEHFCCISTAQYAPHSTASTTLYAFLRNIDGPFALKHPLSEMNIRELEHVFFLLFSKCIHTCLSFVLESKREREMHTQTHTQNRNPNLMLFGAIAHSIVLNCVHAIRAFLANIKLD